MCNRLHSNRQYSSGPTVSQTVPSGDASPRGEGRLDRRQCQRHTSACRCDPQTRDTRIDTLQLVQLGEVSQVVTEDEQRDFWEALAA